MAYGQQKARWNMEDWEDLLADPTPGNSGVTGHNSLTRYVDESLRRIRLADGEESQKFPYLPSRF